VAKPRQLDGFKIDFRQEESLMGDDGGGGSAGVVAVLVIFVIIVVWRCLFSEVAFWR